MNQPEEGQLISRADSSQIEANAEQGLLSELGVDKAALLGAGTEAKVYDFREGQVLKVYAGAARIGMLTTLKDFYDRLDASEVGYDLPKIFLIKERQGLVAVVEHKIEGRPMSEGLSGDDPRLEELYVSTVSALEKVKFTPPLDRYLLFDPKGKSARSERDWNGFLKSLLQEKLPGLLPVLAQDVTGYEGRTQALLDRLSLPYSGRLGVIHGDLYPGNILMAGEGRVSGLIDFGTFTMMGDPLFDLATACAFFRMYETGRAQIRDRMLTRALAKVGEEHRAALYTYLLAYAVLSCDLYPSATGSIRDTGHYQWAAEILCDGSYWRGIT